MFAIDANEWRDHTKQEWESDSLLRSRRVYSDASTFTPTIHSAVPLVPG